MTSTSDEVGHMLDLDAIEARANAATNGEWVADDNEGFSLWKVWQHYAPSGSGHPGIIVADTGREDGEDDATFIAHARTDIPALVAKCRSLRNSHDSLVKALENAESALRYCEQNSLSPNDILRPKVEVTIKSIAAALSQAKGGK